MLEPEEVPAHVIFLLVLAGGPLGAGSAKRLARSRLAGALAGRLDVAAGVGGALLGLDPLDGSADPLPIGPLGGVEWLETESPIGIGDVVGGPVLLDLGGRLAPGRPRTDAGTGPSASRA